MSSEDASSVIRAKTQAEERVCQGDIIRDVKCLESVSVEEGIVEISQISFPLVVVLSQDCDLEQDHAFRTQDTQTQDKWLISVLVVPLYNAEHVFAGEHLIDIGIKSEPINKSSTRGKLLMQNQTPRYHFLEFSEEVPVVPSVIDFKHYFSVPLPYLQNLKETKFVCSVPELYREDISQRFSSFLSRIGLPSAVPAAAP